MESSSTPLEDSPLVRHGRWFVVLGFVGAFAAGLRVVLQHGRVVGDVAVYTDTARAFYVEQAPLGWSLTEETWFWLGLELTAVIGGLAVGALVLSVLARRLTASLPGLVTPLAGASALLSLAALGAGTAVMTRGLPPEGAHALMPDASLDVDGEPGSFQTGEAGLHRVLEHEGNRVAATIEAGGEAFEVTFSNPVGTLEFDPRNLSAGARGLIQVDTTSLDTGVSLRSDSARGYMKTEAHPSASLSIDAVEQTAVAQDDVLIGLTLEGAFTFMGETLTLPIEATLTRLDEKARDDLGIEAAQAFLLSAAFELDMTSTQLNESIENFDNTSAPVQVRLVLVHIP